MSGIGEKLRKAREAKGLSISDIENTTKIQSRYLEAIENNEFDKLPGDFYVRAFIRQYAQIVGLDGKELLNEYSEAPVNEVSNEDYAEAEQPAEEEEAEPEKPEEPEPKAEPEPRYEAPARPAAPQAPRKPAENRGSDNAKWRRLVPRLAIGCGIALLVLVAAIAFANSRKGQNTAGEGASGSSVTISSKKKSSKKSSSASSSSKKTSAVKVAKLGGNAYRVTGLKSSAPLVVRSSSQSIYYYVSVNNAITNQGTLQSGEKHTESVKNNSTVIVYLGTDTGVSVTVAGKKIPFTPVNGTSRLMIYLGKESSSSQSSSTTHQSSTSTQSSYSSASRSRASSSSSRAVQSSQSHASSASSASSSASSQQASSSSQQATSSSSKRVNAAKSSAPAGGSSSSAASSNK